MLEKIRQDKKDNIPIKKKRIAKGAEVITASFQDKKAEEKYKRSQQGVKKITQKKKMQNLKDKRKL